MGIVGGENELHENGWFFKMTAENLQNNI